MGNWALGIPEEMPTKLRLRAIRLGKTVEQIESYVDAKSLKRACDKIEPRSNPMIMQRTLIKIYVLIRRLRRYFCFKTGGCNMIRTHIEDVGDGYEYRWDACWKCGYMNYECK